jgi:hypothetical protein
MEKSEVLLSGDERSDIPSFLVCVKPLHESRRLEGKEGEAGEAECILYQDLVLDAGDNIAFSIRTSFYNNRTAWPISCLF